MPKQAARKRKVGKKGPKPTVSVRRAQDLLSETTHHQESDQQILPTRDPLSNFFSRRKLTADIEESMVMSFRPLSLDNALIFDVKTPDEAWFMDINSLRLSFAGTVKEIDANGKPTDLKLKPTMVSKKTTEKRMVTSVQELDDGGEQQYGIKMVEAEVEFERELFSGLLVTPAPLLPLVMWRRIVVELGGATLPNSCKDLLGFQVYMRTLLEMDPRPMDSQLRCALMVLDSNSLMTPLEGNDRLTYRFQAGGNSRTFDYTTPLIVDGLRNWRQGSLLPGMVPLRLSFERANSKLCLSAVDTREEEQEEGHEKVENRQFTIEAKQPTIEARCYRLSPTAYRDFRDQLQKQEMQIDYEANFMDYAYIYKNTTNFRFRVPGSPANPDRFWFTLLTPDQFRGSYKSNPFWWSPNGLNKIELDYGNNTKKIELDCTFETDHFSKLYNFFLSENNVNFMEGTLPLIPPDLYREGRFGFVLDLTPNHSYGVNDIRALPTLNPVELTLSFKVRHRRIFSFVLPRTTADFFRRPPTAIHKAEFSDHNPRRAGVSLLLHARRIAVPGQRSDGQTERLSRLADDFVLDDGVDGIRRQVFDPPFRLVFVGPSQAGKSTFIKALLASLPRLVPAGYFKRIRYFFGIWSKHYPELLELVPELTFESGGPSAALLENLAGEGDTESKEPTPQLWLIDDLLELVREKNCDLATIFTRTSHHCCISVVFCSQILFDSSCGNALKTIVSNATALFLWRNFKDSRSLVTLSSQIFAGQPPDYISSAVQQLHREDPYEPLVLALSTRFPHDLLRVCSGVLPADDRPNYAVYLPDWTKSKSRKSRSGSSK